MKLILLASLLALAAAAPQIPAPRPEGLAHPYAYPQFQGFPGAYNRGPYDAYSRGGYYPHDPNFGLRGQYDPRIYPGAYDPKHFGAQYDPRLLRHNQQPYDPKYYQQYHQHIPIVEQSSETNPDGSFRYSYATADGQQAQAEGFVKPSELDPQDVANSVKGSYSYTAPDGTPVAYSYVADEYGFRVEGTHVPKSVGGTQAAIGPDPYYQNKYQGYYNQFGRGPYGRSLEGGAPIVPGPFPGAAQLPAPIAPAPKE